MCVCVVASAGRLLRISTWVRELSNSSIQYIKMSNGAGSFSFVVSDIGFRSKCRNMCWVAFGISKPCGINRVCALPAARSLMKHLTDDDATCTHTHTHASAKKERQRPCEGVGWDTTNRKNNVQSAALSGPVCLKCLNKNKLLEPRANCVDRHKSHLKMVWPVTHSVHIVRSRVVSVSQAF